MKNQITEKKSEYQIITDILSKTIKNEDAYFVFPTEITAKAWAEKSLFLTDYKAVELDRFIAWDTFKGTAIRSVKQDRASIPSLLRKLFVENLLENTEEPFFKALIPEQWADLAPSFSSWISSLLPQLARFKAHLVKNLSEGSLNFENSNFEKQSKEILEKIAKTEGDAENRDLLKLENTYAQFLENNGLFEPAWEKPPFHNDGKSYYVFFADITSDYAEYASILENAENVKLIASPSKESVLENLQVIAYENSREEIRKTALFIEELLDTGYAASEIAIHLPEMEELAPYLMRELKLRDIGFQLRAGKALSLYGAGSFFSSMKRLVDGEFSFDSLKQILLNKNLPWKTSVETLINKLLNFGVKNNCLCSYKKKTVLVDLWEEAFKIDYDESLVLFYRSLKNSATEFAKAKSFEALKKNYFEFRSTFFDMEICSEESDLILSRCITELLNCIELEKSYPSVQVKNPLAFFCSHLDTSEYLPQQKTKGVAIFPYKAAAASPYRQHIILNAGQKQVSVLHQYLSFLLKTKRQKLGIEDSNVSEKMLALYSMGQVRFSYSEKGLSHYSLPHTDFQKILAPEKIEGKDIYLLEQNIFYTQGETESDKKTAYPQADFLYKTQKDGFANWIKARPQEEKTKIFSLDSESYEKFLTSVSDRETNMLRVSATKLRDFFFCPLFFLFSRHYKLKNERLETSLLAPVYLGQLYHAILKTFFIYYKDKDEALPEPPKTKNAFQENKTSEAYYPVLESAFKTIMDGFPKSVFPNENLSPLSQEIILNQAPAFFKTLDEAVKIFLSYFYNSRVLETEAWHESKEEKHLLLGSIDLVVEKPNGETWIIDFKTSSPPSTTACLADEEGRLENFQLPLYIRLFEKTKNKRVDGAAFFTINNPAISPLIGYIEDNEGKNKKPYYAKNIVHRNPQNEESNTDKAEVNFNETMQALNKHIEDYVEKISNNIFKLDESIPFTQCAACEYKKLCRTTYRVSGDKKASRGLIDLRF